jgi:hypothetical protein
MNKVLVEFCAGVGQLNISSAIKTALSLLD